MQPPGCIIHDPAFNFNSPGEGVPFEGAPLVSEAKVTDSQTNRLKHCTVPPNRVARLEAPNDRTRKGLGRQLR